MNVKELMKEYLQEEGFKVKEEEFGLAFRYQGCNLIFPDDDDDTFFQILMMGIYEVEANEEAEALKACNRVSINRKVVKCCMGDNNEVNLSFEILIDSTPEVSDIVPRALSMLVQARQCFYQEMKPEE